MPETKAAEQTEILQDAGLGDAGEKIESSESSMQDLGVTYCTLSYTSDLADGSLYTNITRPGSQIAYGTRAVWEVAIKEGYMIDEIVFAAPSGDVLCKISPLDIEFTNQILVIQS